MLGRSTFAVLEPRRRLDSDKSGLGENGRLGDNIRRRVWDCIIIEDLQQRCASRHLARLNLGDVIRQKDVMMDLAKGQIVVDMGKGGFQTVKILSSAFSSPRHFICDVVIRPFSISISTGAHAYS